MTKRNQSIGSRTPFTRDEIVREVRLAALGMASHIANFGLQRGQLDSAANYLGVALDEYAYTSNEGHEQLDLIPIEKHFLYVVVMDAYDHAYQVGSALVDGVQVDERAHEVSGILTGFPQTDFNGKPTPLDKLNPQKLRQVLETFMARYLLDCGSDLTITQLTLLANMGEPAVRSSLSAEGIKTVAGKKGEKNQVPNSEALTWLSGRRGYVPTIRHGGEKDSKAELMFGIFSAESLAFEMALAKALGITGSTSESIAQDAQISAQLVAHLLSPDAATEIDLPSLEKLAVTLEAPVPLFVGRAVSVLLARRASIKSA